VSTTLMPASRGGIDRQNLPTLLRSGVHALLLKHLAVRGGERGARSIVRVVPLAVHDGVEEIVGGWLGNVAC
jgi:hypothetical protein